MSNFTYDKKLVLTRLKENLALKRAALARLPRERREAIEEWRLQVVAFVQRALKKNGALGNAAAFYRKVGGDREHDLCLDGLQPPKPPEFPMTQNMKREIARIEDRIVAVGVMPEGKVFRMTEDRLVKYLEGRFV